MTDFINKNLDLLQNIEFGAIQASKRNPKIFDHHVEEAYSLLKKLYIGKFRGWKNLEILPSESTTGEVFDEIVRSLEIRAGLHHSSNDGNFLLPELNSKVMADCFEKLVKSVNKWSQGGKKSQRYINFVSKYLP